MAEHARSVASGSVLRGVMLNMTNHARNRYEVFAGLRQNASELTAPQ